MGVAAFPGCSLRNSICSRSGHAWELSEAVPGRGLEDSGPLDGESPLQWLSKFQPVCEGARVLMSHQPPCYPRFYQQCLKWPFSKLAFSVGPGSPPAPTPARR